MTAAGTAGERHTSTPGQLDFTELVSGLGFIEGPVITAEGIVVVSLDLGHLYRISDGVVDLVSALGGAPNGAAVDAAGRLYIAQNGGHTPGRTRRSSPGGVQLVRPDGSAAWVTLDPVYPTDLCFGPDGLLYVTDATRRGDYADGRLWRCDPETGAAELLHSVPWFPNGIAFGPDGDLYVASTGDGSIYRCRWDGGRIARPERFARLEAGRPDGLAFDVRGNLLVAAVGEAGDAGSVQVLDPSGTVVERVAAAGSRYWTNLALDVDRPWLVLTDSSAGSILTTTDYPYRGLPLHPFRVAATR